MTIINFEGIDGCGKKTNVSILKKRLEHKGFKTEVFSFPMYDTPTGQEIKKYLNGFYGDPFQVDPYFVSGLYAKDRLAQRDNIIRAVEENKVVILDRYVLSNVVFQSIKNRSSKKLIRNWILDLEFNINKMPAPDIIFCFISMDINNIIKRINKRDNVDLHETNKKLLEMANMEYRRLWYDLSGSQYDDYYLLIPAEMELETISNGIWYKVKKLLEV